jgi:hypothetical protein
MKKIVLSLLVALTVSAAIANTPTSTTMGTAIVKQGSVVKLFYKGISESAVKVSIFNEDRELVFTETVKNTDGFSRPYNFATLQFGDYTIEIDNGIKKETEKVSYLPNGVVNSAAMIKLEEGRRFMLIVPNKTSEKLNITVLDANGDEVYNEIHNLNGDFNKILNLKKLPGHFTVHLRDSTGSTRIFNY